MPVCGGVEAYNERSLCVKYRSQGVQTSFYESTLLPKVPWENKICQGPTEDPGNVKANIPDASKERIHRDTSRYSRVLFEHIPGTRSVWKVASSNRFKITDRPHLCTSLSHAHYKLSAEYR